MPRARKAGPSANRTDLAQPAPPTPGPSQVQPVTVPTGLPYGEAGQLRTAQQAQPLPATGPGTTPIPAPAAAPPAYQGSVVQSDAQGFALPPGRLNAPSDRPNEPITAGLPIGAGPGPEAIGQTMGTPTLGDLLTRLSINPLAGNEVTALLNRVRGGAQ